MNSRSFISISAALALTLGLTGAHGQDTGAAGDYRPRPLATRYATTADGIALRSSVRYFDSVELQEADSFDGYTAEFELTVPFWQNFQLRLLYPAYTEGEARLTQIGNPRRGEKIDIEGNGGTFEFARAILDYQFMQATAAGEWNLAAFAGWGGVLDYLDTSADGDVYNHQGRVVLFGLKADRRLSSAFTGAANLAGRYYYKSDDLNPEDENSDVFALMDASASIVYHPSWAWVQPAVEIVYQGDLGTYNQISLDPQLLFVVTPHLDVKAGTGIGLTNDGERWHALLEAVLHF